MPQIDGPLKAFSLYFDVAFHCFSRRLYRYLSYKQQHENSVLTSALLVSTLSVEDMDGWYFQFPEMTPTA